MKPLGASTSRADPLWAILARKQISPAGLPDVVLTAPSSAFSMFAALPLVPVPELSDHAAVSRSKFACRGARSAAARGGAGRRSLPFRLLGPGLARGAAGGAPLADADGQIRLSRRAGFLCHQRVRDRLFRRGPDSHRLRHRPLQPHLSDLRLLHDADLFRDRASGTAALRGQLQAVGRQSVHRGNCVRPSPTWIRPIGRW
jgi:hypothetical protein